MRIKHGRWFTWVVPGAVVAVAVLAGLDALRSSDGEPTASTPSPTEPVTTMQTETGAEVETSAALQYLQLVKLPPGRVRTDRNYPAFDSFRVPPGWYGYQSGGGYQIGKELNGTAVAFRSGGISVEPLGDRFSLSLARAARDFEKLRDIRIKQVSPVRIGGCSGRRYALVVDKPVSLQPLGVMASLQPGEPDVILLDVPGGNTNNLIIRRGFDSDQERAEIDRVLMSFEFSR